MILRVEHIGIAVKDMKGANTLFEALLGISNYKVESVESENVATSFFKTGETKIELLESTSDSGPIGKSRGGKSGQSLLRKKDKVFITLPLKPMT